jgi:hypothetical protein
MALLMQGRALADVIEEIGDPDVARVLTHLAGDSKRYEAEHAVRATRQILGKLRDREIEVQLRDLNGRLLTCAPGSEEFRHLTSKKVELQRERVELSATRGGPAP